VTKIVAWTITGSYPVPFFPFSLASYYNVVDEIVVLNAGWNFPDMTEDNVPLPEVTETIKRLDVNGKVHEIHDMDWGKLAGIDEGGFKPTKLNTGIRALAATLANDYAGGLGADWVLWTASDQVYYENAKQIRALTENPNGIDGFQFYEHKAFWGSQWYMCKDATDPYSNSDGAKLYMFKGDHGQRQWFRGEGGIMSYRQQYPCDSVLTAHMRECWPMPKGDLDLENLLTYQIARYYTLHIDGRNVAGQKVDHRQVFNFAVHCAQGICERARWENLRDADPIPKIYHMTPEQYIAEGEPR
jgi:hypothetical protein